MGLFVAIFVLVLRLFTSAGLSNAWSVGVAIVLAFLLSGAVAEVLGIWWRLMTDLGLIATVGAVVLAVVIFGLGVVAGRWLWPKEDIW